MTQRPIGSIWKTRYPERFYKVIDHYDRHNLCKMVSPPGKGFKYFLIDQRLIDSGYWTRVDIHEEEKLTDKDFERMFV